MQSLKPHLRFAESDTQGQDPESSGGDADAAKTSEPFLNCLGAEFWGSQITLSATPSLINFI